MKKLLIILFTFISFGLSAQIIADHEAVSRYQYIPQQYIDSVKKMLIWVPGMSHGYGYFRGAELLEQLDAKYALDLWYNTDVPAESSTGLRLGRPGLGAEGMWTSDTWFGINEDYISDQNETGNRFNYVWFGWSYQATWDNAPGGGLDSVYNVHWAGRTDDGPDGSNRWGLDAEDYALTGNSVCMDTYLNRWVQYQDSIDAKDDSTLMILSTLIVDGDYASEAGYQRELKSQYIRDYVAAHSNSILFDYGDILRYNNSGEDFTTEWNDGGTGREYSRIHTDNQMDYDASWNIIDPQSDVVEDHIGEVGALRLGKAMWWLLARLAGWDGTVNYYVSTTGSDSNPGTITQPFATWKKAFETARPGDTVFFRGGTYYSTNRIVVNPQAYGGAIGYSGTTENPITYMSYPGEWAILDCRYHVNTYGMFNGVYNYAINLNYVEHIKMKDFEVRNVWQLDSVLTGAITSVECVNLTFDHIVLNNVGQRGFYILGGAWNPWDGADPDKIEPPGYWGYASEHPDTTRFINCDVYDLMDTLSVSPGNGADAWKTVHYAGNYVEWIGCRAWNYSDDGVDPTGFGAIRIFDNCWFMASNKYYDPEAEWIPERNGLKNTASRPDDWPYFYDTLTHFLIVKNCLAVYSAVGFLELDWYSRNNSLYYNNTAYANAINFDAVTCDDTLNSTRRFNTYRNNIAYGATTNHPGIGEPYNVRMVCAYEAEGDQYKESNNTWDYHPLIWIPTDTVTVTDDDFVSVDSTTIVSLFTAARQADGSLPLNKPLQLATGSDLIDAGIQIPAWDTVGMALTYIGAAPDIGYAEYGIVDETATDILSFVFSHQIGTSVINATTHTVTATLQYGEDISAITPTFALSPGATSVPASGAEDDYTNPVTITVTAADAVTEQEWTVTITEDEEPVPTVATVGTIGANYTAVTASITGRIYSANGGTLTARGICYNTTGSPTLSDRHTKYTPYVGSFTDKIYGLRGGTTYFFRAYATTEEGGTSYGQNRSFTTPAKSWIGGFRIGNKAVYIE